MAGERDAGEGLGRALLADEAGRQLLQLRQVARLHAGFGDRRVGVGIAHEGFGLALVAALGTGQQRYTDQEGDVDGQAHHEAARHRVEPGERAGGGQHQQGGTAFHGRPQDGGEPDEESAGQARDHAVAMGAAPVEAEHQGRREIGHGTERHHADGGEREQAGDGAVVGIGGEQDRHH